LKNRTQNFFQKLIQPVLFEKSEETDWIFNYDFFLIFAIQQTGARTIRSLGIGNRQCGTDLEIILPSCSAVIEFRLRADI